MKIIILLLFLLPIKSLTLANTRMVQIEVNPARLLPLLVEYHFDEITSYYHTKSNLWFEKPNIVMIETEIYPDFLIKLKREGKFDISEKQIILQSKNRVIKLLERLMKKFKINPSQVYIKQKSIVMPAYDFTVRDWIKIDTSDL